MSDKNLEANDSEEEELDAYDITDSKKLYEYFNRAASELTADSVLMALIQSMSDVVANVSIGRGISVEYFSNLIHRDILEHSNIKFAKFKNKKVH